MFEIEPTVEIEKTWIFFSPKGWGVWVSEESSGYVARTLVKTGGTWCRYYEDNIAAMLSLEEVNRYIRYVFTIDKD